MFALDPDYQDHFEDRELRLKLLKQLTIENICKDILRRGDNTVYQEILDYMHEYVEDNIEKFLPEKDFWELT